MDHIYFILYSIVWDFNIHKHSGKEDKESYDYSYKCSYKKYFESHVRTRIIHINDAIIHLIIAFLSHSSSAILFSFSSCSGRVTNFSGKESLISFTMLYKRVCCSSCFFSSLATHSFMYWVSCFSKAISVLVFVAILLIYKKKSKRIERIVIFQ